MTDLPASTAPAAAGHPLVQGRCPACRGSSLFLGSGGYLTCSRLDCPNPSAADDLLHRTTPAVELREALAATFAEKIDGTEGCANRYRLADAALATLTAHLDIGDAEAWCKTCRRVWDSKRHRCEGDAEQRLYRVRDLVGDGPPAGTAPGGEWEGGWDSAMDAVKEVLNAPITEEQP